MLTNTLCGAAIATPDRDATLAFYQALFGWPIPDVRPAEATARWETFIAVDDLDATLHRAEALGARHLDGSPNEARLVDPTGATFGLRTSPNDAARLAKHDLYADDTDRAADFYAALFGYTAKTTDLGDFAYTTLSTPDGIAAVLCGLLPAFSPVSYWQPFFWVADAEAAVRQAEALGADILCPAMTHDGQTFAHVRDPQGALFGVMEVRA